MSWIAAAVVGGSVVGSVVSSKGQKSATKSANAANKAMADEANALDYLRFRESRGAKTEDGQRSAILPEYFGTAESDVAKSIVDRWMQDRDLPEDSIYRDTRVFMDPAFQQGNQFVTDVFADRVYEDQLALADEAATADRFGINAAAEEAIGKIRTNRLRTGLGGGSSFENNMIMGSTLPARVDAASRDARTRQGLYAGNVALKSGMLDTPMARIQQADSISQLGGERAYDDIDRALSRLSFYNIGPGQAPAQRVPQLSAVPNSQMMFGSALSAGAQAFGGAYGAGMLGGGGGGGGFGAGAASTPVGQSSLYNNMGGGNWSLPTANYF